MSRSPLFLAILIATTLLMANELSAAAPADRNRTEADLKAINARIERVRQQIQKDVVERDRVSRALKDVEMSVAEARGELMRLRQERAQRSAERERLLVEREGRESDRDRTQDSLSAQLRAAYMMGSNETLKVLLNQRDPAQIGRNLAYYGYFGRLRADQIRKINENISKIDELTSIIEAEEQEIEKLEELSQSQLSNLETTRRRRGTVLASLERETRNRSAALKRLEQQQDQLERLLRELSRAVEPRTPIDPNDSFAKLRGKLSWPVAGKLVAQFGEPRGGSLRWDGVVIATERGRPVQAIHSGRVIYSDWLPGMGLLLIVDHGNGYWSLYGHNESLFRKVGAGVKGGETIAAAGDSGGRSQSGLYFEIRHSGKPVNPRQWFGSANPPKP